MLQIAIIALLWALVAIILRTFQKISVVLVPIVLQKPHVTRHDVQFPVEQRDLHDEHLQWQVTEDVQQQIVMLVFLALAKVCQDRVYQIELLLGYGQPWLAKSIVD